MAVFRVSVSSEGRLFEQESNTKTISDKMIRFFIKVDFWVINFKKRKRFLPSNFVFN